jgi:hypothetical protein
MSADRLRRLSLLVLIAGCGGAPAAVKGAADAAVPGPTHDAGVPKGDSGTTLVTEADGATHPVQYTAAPPPIDPPGIPVTGESATVAAPNPCAGKTLGEVLAAIRDADPTLADIQNLYAPATPSADGTFIYAYEVALGFDVIFKRGLGTCAGECTENDYQYWATDAACRPTKVGHYHATWGSGTCLTVDGAPMWTHPLPPDPLTVCGADNSPRDLRGAYGMNAAGQHTPCALAAAAVPFGGPLELVIDQDPHDLANGFVTFTGTGDALVDGVPLPARFQRRRFDAALMETAPPDACPRTAAITARYDFEGYQPGGLEALDFGDTACGACKGSMSLTLGVSTEVP